MSYPNHLTCINKHFYYRIIVPVDLKQYFPSSIIQKTLKTTNIKDAKPLLLATEYKVQRAFALLRTGMLDDDIALQVVKEIIPSKGGVADSGIMGCNQIVAVKNETLLSEVVKKYIAENESGWTAKSKMEFKSVFRLLQDVLGNIDVSTITKQVAVELRSILQKLPPNIYKKYPGKTIQQILACNYVEPMSVKSVNKHVSRLGAMLRYCVDEGMISSNAAFSFENN